MYTHTHADHHLRTHYPHCTPQLALTLSLIHSFVHRSLLHGSATLVSSLDVIEYDDDSDIIDLTNTRLTTLPSFNNCHRLTSLTLRSNFLTSAHLPPLPTLTDLDLYENRLTDLTDCTLPPSLTSLDVSFNQLRHITNLTSLPRLTHLYLVNNRLHHIDSHSLDGLPQLQLLELGANRMRSLDSLPPLPHLHSLFLGRNKLTSLHPLSAPLLPSLRVLSLSSNRLTDTSFGSGVLGELQQLTELYVSHNGITQLAALGRLPTQLAVLDVSSNQLSSLRPLAVLERLVEVWASDNRVEEWSEVESGLSGKSMIGCVYLEGNPVVKRVVEDGLTYAARMKRMCPSLKQLDADEV